MRSRTPTSQALLYTTLGVSASLEEIQMQARKLSSSDSKHAISTPTPWLQDFWTNQRLVPLHDHDMLGAPPRMQPAPACCPARQSLFTKSQNTTRDAPTTGHRRDQHNFHRLGAFHGQGIDLNPGFAVLNHPTLPA